MAAYRCGHPRTPENTTPDGQCRTCKRSYQAAWVRAKRERDPDYAIAEADRHATYRVTTAGFLARIRRNGKRREESLIARIAALRGVSLDEARAEHEALRAAMRPQAERMFATRAVGRIDLADRARAEEEAKRKVLEHRRVWREYERR
jgi:hypothetical protein